MEAGHATPHDGHDHTAWLEAQHARDLDALDTAADLLAAAQARITHLEREQTILIHQARDQARHAR